MPQQVNINWLSSFLNERGYHNIVIHTFPEGMDADYSCRFALSCSTCLQLENIKIGYNEIYGSSHVLLDVIALRTTEFAKKHEHKSTVEGPLVGIHSLRYCAKSLSKYVDVEILPPTISVYNPTGDDSCTLRLHCNYCGMYYIHPVTGGKTLSTFAEQVAEFAGSHKHDTIQMYQYPTATPVGPKIGLYGSPIIPKPEGAKNWTTGTPNILDGNPSKPINISQDVLKEVYRLSNFNVDLQGRFVGSLSSYDYRARCTQCDSTWHFNANDLHATYKETYTWQSMHDFCLAHRHGGESQQTLLVETYPVDKIKTGRKFKDLYE